tara:strand:+ start:1034 stop:1318 length:285 start_codon:yes stop_codon:yes gene_type:complete
MLKWLGKLKWWKQSKSPDLVVYDYGRYLYKPVTQRALAEVMGLTQTDLVTLVRDGEVRLNDSPLDSTHLVLRLESGNYEVVAPSLGKVWRFFIG